MSVANTVNLPVSMNDTVFVPLFATYTTPLSESTPKPSGRAPTASRVSSFNPTGSTTEKVFSARFESGLDGR